MSKKLIWIIVSLVVLVGVLIGLKKAGIIGKEEGTKITTEKVEQRTIIETVNASGKIYPEIEVKVSPDISGEVVELNVEEGDSVRAGQILARIYADIYSSQRDQASAGVSAQQAQVRNAEAQLEALKATVEQAQYAYNRQKKLLDDKVISRAEFEQADQALKSAQANLNAARQAIEGNKASVQSAMAQLNRASKDVSRATITAPMSGIVSLLAVKQGERVVGTAQMAGTEMLRIADMSVIEVRVDVGENDIPKVHFGDSALVEVDAYSDRKFKGIVTKIASSSTASGLAQASATDVTNYKVHIRLLKESYQDLLEGRAGRNFPFRPGMNASADIQTKRHENVLAVPINAVTTREKKSEKAPNSKKEKKDENEEEENNSPKPSTSDDDIEEVVYVLNADKTTVRRVRVKSAIQDINYIEIIDGLKAGDEVVTGPYNVVSKTLKEGQKVKVVKKEDLYESGK